METAAMSWYITIRSDSAYSRSTPVPPLVEHLQMQPELRREGPQVFRNSPDSPWLWLCVARADAAGNFAIEDAPPPTINVVELVCGRGDERWYESLARRVASFLKWEAVEEHGERTIYPAD